MNIADFDYDLPPERIAQEPLPARDASRLMVLPRAGGALEHRTFRDLPDLLDAGDLLVVNRTRVFPARLLGRKPTGGAVEVFLLRDRGDGGWDAYVRPGRRLRPGQQVRVGPELTVEIESEAEGPDGHRRVRLTSRTGPLDEVLERVGHVPLPPYVQREDRPADRERYQTVFARERGSVAAPTAGLHFTPELFARLQARGIERAEVVLHVGPGTFKPVQVEDVREHRVDPEPFEVPPGTAAAIAAARARGRRVVAVGTTVVRTLETAVQADGSIQAGRGETALVVTPGFAFRAVDALVTNFHLPRSSLLLLVAAFAGRDRVLDAYGEAVARGYRFYSYGDAMLIR